MDHLEQDLRAEFVRRVATLPGLPGLAEAAVRRGRRARRRRAATATCATSFVVVFALAAASLLPSSGRRADIAAAALAGPPRVPVFLAQGGVVDWVDGERRTRQIGEARPVAQVPAGLLVVAGFPLALGLLGADGEQPRILMAGLAAGAVAVSDDGRRATVAAPSGQLRELELPSGRVLRTAFAPQSYAGEPVLPVAYSGGAVLLTIGEGSRQRSALWERGDDQVVGALDGFGGVLGGADADFSGDRDAVGGRGAFAVPNDRCRTEVHQLRNGDGSPWKLCGETFAGFSPDGEGVLAADATGKALVVRGSGDGDVKRTWTVPTGPRTYAWESSATVLYATVEGDRTVVVRCSVRSGDCATAAEFFDLEGVPQPVRSVG